MSIYEEMNDNHKNMLNHFNKAKAAGYLPAFYSFADYLMLELMRTDYFKHKPEVTLLDFYPEGSA